MRRRDVRAGGIVPAGGLRLCFAAMGIQVTGRLYAIFETKQVTDRFQKREFVLEMTDKSPYSQYVLFQLTGDRVNAVDGFKVGDEVQVDFSLRGREWTSRTNEVKYFNSLDVWTIEAAGGGRGRPEEPPLPDAEPVFDDDVPF